MSSPPGALDSTSIFELKLATLPLNAPFVWLRKGWQDFVRQPLTGLFYGLCFFLMGHALWWVFAEAPAYVLALSAGFLLMGPFLCLGLYHASRELEHGRVAALVETLLAWRPARAAIGLFAGVLLVLELLWGRASLVVFAVSFDLPPGGQLMLSQLLALENIAFLITFTLVCGVFASLIFVSSVIAIPMILDRQVDAVSAALTSVRACVQNPGVMLLWGALIATLVALSMLPYFAGLLLVGPVIGHASWHAYRSIVAPGAAQA